MWVVLAENGDLCHIALWHEAGTCWPPTVAWQRTNARTVSWILDRTPSQLEPRHVIKNRHGPTDDFINGDLLPLRPSQPRGVHVSRLQMQDRNIRSQNKSKIDRQDSIPAPLWRPCVILKETKHSFHAIMLIQGILLLHTTPWTEKNTPKCFCHIVHRNFNFLKYNSVYLCRNAKKWNRKCVFVAVQAIEFTRTKPAFIISLISKIGHINHFSSRKVTSLWRDRIRNAYYYY